jgi:hypothetical protein
LLVPLDFVPPEFPLVPGDFLTPAKYSPPEQLASQDLLAYEETVLAVDQALPQFEGEVAGIRLYSYKHAFEDPSVDKKWCVAQEFPLAEELSFDYLPPGTYAEGPQFAGTCADGSISFVMRMFLDFDIIYYPGERALGHDASAGRVTTGVIQGKEAVIIVPLLEHALRRMWVGFPTENGFIAVDSFLPLTETLKVAEGVRCENC